MFFMIGITDGRGRYKNPAGTSHKGFKSRIYC